MIEDARRHLSAGRKVIPCEAGGKRPIGASWASSWPADRLLPYLEAHPDCNLGLVMGDVIDIEWDSVEQHAAFGELFAGVDIPRTPCFCSTRGKHYFFKAHPRLTELGGGEIHYRKLGIRIGAGKAAQTVIPPSIVGGVARVWEVSFDDCPAAELPEIVVDRIIAARKPAPPDRALTAMLRIKRKDQGDGSKRLLAYCCRGVEHDLDDVQIVAAVRECEKQNPFSHEWSDGEIIQRVRDAEKKVVRGSSVIRKPEFDVTTRDLDRLTAQVWELIGRANEPPTLYRFGGLPARVELDDSLQPYPKTVTPDILRHHLAEWGHWFRRTKESESACAPPAELVNNILATPNMPLPILERITEAPVFAPGGELQTEPGYHPASRTLYAPASGFEVPAIPVAPTADDIRRASKLICQELLGDFPFVGDAERAHAVSLLLLPFARGLIAGPTPLHLFEKPSPGTGATLLVDVLTYPATGHQLAAMTEGGDDNEWRKRLTAKLRISPNVLLIDNLRETLDSAAVASAISSLAWEDRLLGASETIRVPVRCAWVATGNNPKISSEITRRTIRIRLNANTDRPWLRANFRHADLRGWVHANRAELVWASLTLVQAWIAAGRPPGGSVLGMFEDWSLVMGGILQLAGIPGFLGNLAEFYEQTDTHGGAVRNFLASWWATHNGAEVQAKELFTIARDDEALGLGAGGEHSQRVRLGKILSDLRERVFDVEPEPGRVVTLRVDQPGTRQRAALWRLSRLDTPAVSV